MDVPSAYDALAPYFRAYCLSRAAYLNSIDQLVIRHAVPPVDSLLDVGAGDGFRAARIARACGLSEFVLADPSAAMIAYCQRQGASEVWQAKAEDLPETERRFNIVTCLWNVLGHVGDSQSRVAALRAMAGLLTDKGRIFLDVNNRYNARAYGWLPTLARMLYDRLKWSETNGDVVFKWKTGRGVITARGHVFTPGEMAELFSRAGLEVERCFTVDYGTGHLRRFATQGQLFYELRRSEK